LPSIIKRRKGKRKKGPDLPPLGKRGRRRITRLCEKKGGSLSLALISAEKGDAFFPVKKSDKKTVC